MGEVKWIHLTVKNLDVPMVDEFVLKDFEPAPPSGIFSINKEATTLYFLDQGKPFLKALARQGFTFKGILGQMVGSLHEEKSILNQDQFFCCLKGGLEFTASVDQNYSLKILPDGMIDQESYSQIVNYLQKNQKVDSYFAGQQIQEVKILGLDSHVPEVEYIYNLEHRYPEDGWEDSSATQNYLFSSNKTLENLPDLPEIANCLGIPYDENDDLESLEIFHCEDIPNLEERLSERIEQGQPNTIKP